jgi:hypothetical protein
MIFLNGYVWKCGWYTWYSVDEIYNDDKLISDQVMMIPITYIYNIYKMGSLKSWSMMIHPSTLGLDFLLNMFFYIFL